MKSFSLLLAGLLMSAGLVKGQEKISLPSVKAIATSSMVRVVIVKDSACSITYSAPQVKEAVGHSVSGSVLNITKGEKPLGEGTVTVAVNTLERLDITGLSEVVMEQQIPSESLSVIKSGAGDVSLWVNATELNINHVGPGDITVKGKCSRLILNNSGSGDVRAYDLEAGDVTVNGVGSGDMRVNASGNLRVNITGSGDVYYIGKPANVDVNITGSGNVKEMAYSEKNVRDTTRLSFGDKKLIIIDEEESNDDKEKKAAKGDEVKDIYKGFEIGVNGYMTTAGSFYPGAGYKALDLNYGKSINLNLNISEWHVKLYKNYIALTSGLGFEFNRYFINRNFNLMPYSDSTIAIPVAQAFKKNILKSTFITAPLLLEFNTHKDEDKSFHLAMGGFVGYRLGGKLKQVYNTGGDDITLKIRNDYNLNPLKYGLMVRAGYGKVNMYATYALSELFQTKNQGPVLQPFSVGFTLIPF